LFSTRLFGLFHSFLSFSFFFSILRSFSFIFLSPSCSPRWPYRPNQDGCLLLILTFQFEFSSQ
jgi:hypothetical protein